MCLERPIYLAVKREKACQEAVELRAAVPPGLRAAFVALPWCRLPSIPPQTLAVFVAVFVAACHLLSFLTQWRPCCQGSVKRKVCSWSYRALNQDRLLRVNSVNVCLTNTSSISKFPSLTEAVF